jgi:hypothetical protein
MGQRTSRIVRVSSLCTFLRPRKQTKTTLVVGRRGAGNKGANGEDSGGPIAGEQLGLGKRKSERKKRKNEVRASKAPGSARCKWKLTQNGSGQQVHTA